MANINITSPEGGKTDTVTISISPKSLAKINEQKVISQRTGLSAEESVWYRFQSALFGAGLATAD